MHTYQIEIQGRIDGNNLNAGGPLQFTVLREDEVATVFAVRTDQSGLIGLLRHLHGRGAALLSVRYSDPTPSPSPLWGGEGEG
jgi:hypothetical protein